MKIKSLAVSAALLLSFNASANFFCVGLIEEIAVRHSGNVSVFSQDLWGTSSYAIDVCSLENEWQGVSVATCQGWFSQLLAAKAARTTVRIQYTNSALSCETIPAFDAADRPHAIRTE